MSSFPLHTCDFLNNYLNKTVSKMSDPAQASETSGDCESGVRVG